MLHPCSEVSYSLGSDLSGYLEEICILWGYNQVGHVVGSLVGLVVSAGKLVT